MATANKTKKSEQFGIPKEVIEDAAERFRDLQKADSGLMERSSVELLSANRSGQLEKRLERLGVKKSKAKAATKSIKQRAGGSLESLTESAALSLRAERILGTNDLVDVRYLLNGARVTASVGRIVFPGRGFATGFLVAPGVIMTNWHVFGSKRDVRGNHIEFGYREIDEETLAEATSFSFDPDRLFFSDREHDFAIVAIGDRIAGDINLDSIPFCPLVRETNAVVTGERINIIQHPAGEPKQVAMRDNRAVGVDDVFLHYRADTKRGSSGSPVFNDEWELIGLHHSGVPRTNSRGQWLAVNGSVWKPSMGDQAIDWIANEAILASALVNHLEFQEFSGEEDDLVGLILNPPEIDEVEAITAGILCTHPTPSPASSSATSTKIQIPIEINVQVGADGTVSANASVDSAATGDPVAEAFESFGIDRDYSNRNGYDEEFLGLTLPMPGLTDTQLLMTAINQESEYEDDYELTYHNFSVVMNKVRRIAFFTAVNIDGGTLRAIRRKSSGGHHSWIADPRIEPDEQTNNEDHYKHNPLDRGHLVRRLDSAWGGSRRDAARGIVDTFHFTNCTPQYNKFNQGKGPDGLWLGLEDYVLKNAKSEDQKVTVFTGPVFRDHDPDFRDNGLPIPVQYWKVIAWLDDNEELQSAAFLLSQESLLNADPRIEKLGDEAFDFRGREAFQTTVANIASLTSLDFGDLVDANALESDATDVKLSILSDIRTSQL